jgi:hypothetical protein
MGRESTQTGMLRQLIPFMNIMVTITTGTQMCMIIEK